MSAEDLRSTLAGHRFFEGMPTAYVEMLSKYAGTARYGEDDEIFREGGDAHSFYVIQQGRVALELSAPGQKPVTIQTSGEGDVLGWSWLVGPHRWRYTARALRVTQVVVLDGSRIRAGCEEDRDFGYELLKRVSGVLAHRLEATRLQLMDIYATQD